MPIDDFINKIDITNAEFQSALAMITETNRSVFLTGKAGTGKSTFLKYLTANTSKNFVLLAPTGIAAINVGGQTLHSFFKLPFKPFLPDDPQFSKKELKKRLKYSKDFKTMLKSIELIIIDEISMVRADTIDFIDRILREYTNNRREPFGGKQLLLVGDVFQLEPVVTSDVRQLLQRHYSAPYFFNAKVFEEMSLVSIELRKVYRQKDKDFVGLLDRIRIGQPEQSDITAINSRLAGEIDDSRNNGFTMTIATRRDMVDNINQTHLDAIEADEVTYVGKVAGDFPINSYPTDLHLTLKEGAQVIFIKNDRNHRWVNGTIGRVVELDDDSVVVETENGSKHKVEVEVWSNIQYELNEETNKLAEKEIGTFTQYPLKLAWAITIHKSQGLTFNRIIIDIGHGAFSGGQSYVALSRCTSLEGITMRSTINLRDVFVSPVIRRFSQSFNDMTEYNKAISDARSKRMFRNALEAYNANDIVSAASMVLRGLAEKPDLLKSETAHRLMTRKLNDYVKAGNRKCYELMAENTELQRRLDSLETAYLQEAEECREAGWDMAAAMQAYDKALTVNPRSMRAVIGKSEVLAAMGDADSAISLLDVATRLWPEDWEPSYALGRLFLSLGDCANALDRLLIALDRCDEKAEVHEALAEVYLSLNDKSSARKHSSKAKALRGNKR